jgi:hypothetical protein
MQREDDKDWAKIQQERMAVSGVNQIRKAIFSPLGSLRKGGRVKATGVYRLHSGERVIPAGRGNRRHASR